MKSNLKNALALILAAVTLLSFSACTDTEGPGGTQDTTAEQVKNVELDLTAYKLIRPVNMSDLTVADVVSFRKALNEKLDAKMLIEDDWLRDGETDEIRNALEILIGQTTRSASAEAIADVDNPTKFVIKITESKIIINSPSEAGVSAGLDYFLTLVDGKTLSLPENYLYMSDGIPVIDVVKNAETAFKIVFSDGLDNTAVSTNANDRLDLEVVYAKDIKQKLQNLTGGNLVLATDWKKPSEDTSDSYEILIGSTNRPESAEFISRLGADGYGYAVIGNKICIAGSNLTTLELAYKDFMTFISASVSSGK
ncbi:MAG: hypothetical protein MJ137_08375 [Clostridia bacterium]|nr:hypothetical protein [Clostridia bacterium]